MVEKHANDAAIFKQMGLAVLRGKTMYVDYFDNKGCILYHPRRGDRS
jgi:hypothetical protein